jgi:hypothetical protein
MAMKGALVFLAVFAIVVIITIAGVALPPGEAIYNAVLSGTAEYTVQYAIVGTNAFTLIVAVFNGVIYGFIVWLAFTIINALTKKDKKEHVNVNVVVNNNGANPPPPPPQ